MIKIYVRFSIRTCKEGNNKISSFSKVTDVPQMSFLKFAKQEIAHAHKIGCYSMAQPSVPLKNNILTYNRHKTNYTVCIHLKPCIRAISLCRIFHHGLCLSTDNKLE